MKKKWSAILTAVVLAILWTCVVFASYDSDMKQTDDTGETAEAHLPEDGDYVYQVLNNENLEKIREHNPVEISLWIDQEGARSTALIKDEETIQELVSAFAKIRIDHETDEACTDNYNGFSFTFKDGETVTFHLNMKNLEYTVDGKTHIYVLEDFGEFWKMMETLTDSSDRDRIPDQTEKGYNTAVQLTEEMIQEMNDGKAVFVYDDEGYISFLDGRFYDKPVKDYEEAIHALNGVAELLGISKGCEFYAVYGASDSAGYTYLTYKQRYGNVTIENASLKIVLDPEGYPCLLSCSFAREIGTDHGADKITAKEAENRIQMLFFGKNLEILPECTRETSVLINDVACHAWEVYSNNIYQASKNSRPYLKHIVLYDGTYYKTLQVSTTGEYEQGDVSSSANAELFFEMLTPRTYTGMVALHDGTKEKVTVPVGYDEENGGYYLVDPERKIAVADYAARAYESRYDMVWSADNSGWDNKAMIAYSTYCKVYDYFRAKGMDSVDGFGIPILILTDYCDSDGTPIDNACFLGIQDGWALFASSDANNFGEAVDVIAHEYTHGIREYSLGGDLYENKTGAIHEAYSDIMGNICEMELGETTDSSWLIGETCGRILRSMSEPNQYCQPSFEGDRYYCGETEYPTEDNDQGGVHINSGILGNIAWQIAGLGLSYNEQYWLWTKSNELLTPLSDYDDVCAALMFVSRISGYPQEITDGIVTIFGNAKVLDHAND